jgi:hypothetical protein
MRIPAQCPAAAKSMSDEGGRGAGPKSIGRGRRQVGLPVSSTWQREPCIGRANSFAPSRSPIGRGSRWTESTVLRRAKERCIGRRQVHPNSGQPPEI